MPYDPRLSRLARQIQAQRSRVIITQRHRYARPETDSAPSTFDPPTLTDGGTAFGSWTASTEPDVGTSATSGWDENAIGSWITPTLDVLKSGETMYIGVIARHMNGIAKVQFSLNGGSWVDVAQETTNPNDQGRGVSTTAYWVRVTADGSAAYRNEVRAKLIPSTAGKPLILQGDVTTSVYYSDSGSQFTHRFEFYNAKSGYEHPTDPVEIYCGDFGQGTPNDTNNGLTKAAPVATLQQAYYRLGGNAGSGSTSHDISGKTVWLGSGNFNHEGYTFGKLTLASKAFVHVRKDPEIAKSSCVYNGDSDATGSTGLRMSYVAFHDITVTPRAGTTLTGTVDSIDIYDATYAPCFKNWSAGILWLDGCTFTSPNGTNCFDAAYVKTDHPSTSESGNTNSNADPTMFGLTTGYKTLINTFPTVSYWHSSPCYGLLCKHVTMDHCAEDIIRNCQMAYKVVATNVDAFETEAHADVWQSYRAGGTVQNQLCIDVTAHDNCGVQGFFCHGDTALFRDIWIENWRVENDNDGTFFASSGGLMYSSMQWQQPLRHVVCKDVRIQSTNPKFLVYNSGGAANDFTATNVYMRGVYFKLDSPTISDVATFETGDGGPSLGTFPGTLPWSDSGITYESL